MANRNIILFMPNRFPRPHFPLVAFMALAFAMPAMASETLPGPVQAKVVRVIDGDTFVAEARIWPGQTVTVNVRLRSIDAPEIRSRCPAEKVAGKKAKMALERMIGGSTVAIRNISGGKYYGRVLADVTTRDGRPVAEQLLGHALVRAYAGGKRQSACG